MHTAHCTPPPPQRRPDERGLGALLQRRLRRNPKPTQHRQVGFEALINKAKSKKCMVGITAVDMGLLDSIRGAVLNSVRGDGGGGGDGSGGGGSRSAADDGGGAHADRKRCLVLVLDEAAPMIDDPAAGWLPLATNGNGVVVLLGDNRGLNAEEEQGYVHDVSQSACAVWWVATPPPFLRSLALAHSLSNSSIYAVSEYPRSVPDTCAALITPQTLRQGWKSWRPMGWCRLSRCRLDRFRC